MERWTPDAEGLEKAARALKEGKLIGLPTETVYGLAGDARSEATVARIFEVKRRPTFDPLIVHTDTTQAAFDLAVSVPELARRLADHFWPGPLTIVLPRRPDLPDLLSAGLETLAVRVPSHTVARALLRECGLPLAAPSANRFGRISPTCADHVMEEFGDDPRVAGVLDAGPCEKGVESTVVHVAEDGRVRVYRPGATPLEMIREVVEQVEVVPSPVEAGGEGGRSPGMLKSHYAPATPLMFLEPEDPAPAEPGRVGWLGFSDLPEGVEVGEILSARGDMAEAANRLFACLRKLDGLGLDLLIARKVPDHGLGRAINDRLQRAAFR